LAIRIEHLLKKFRAILIDDEKHAQSVLEELLKHSSFSFDIVAKCDDLIDGIEKIKALKPELVFLDVQMPTYAGYEILNFFDKIDFEIIFVTAYDKFAIKAFELNAIDYLLKPIDRTKLNLALQKFSYAFDTKATVAKYHKLANSFTKSKPYRLIIPELNNRRIVDVDAILAIEAAGAYATIHLSDSNFIFTSKNLKYFEDTLSHTQQFFRCHRSWLVQLRSVSSMNRTSGTLCIDNSKLKIKISRNLYQDFEDSLFQLKENER